MHNQDECGSNLRCNKAEEAGATACLLYNIEGIAGPFFFFLYINRIQFIFF